MSDFEQGLEQALHNARTRGEDGGHKDGSICTMCIVIAHAKPHAKQELIASSAGKLSVRALHRALRASGVRIDRMSVQQHRNEGHTP